MIIGSYKRVGQSPLDGKRHTHIGEFEIIQSFTDGGDIIIDSTIFPLTYGGIYLIGADTFHLSLPRNGTSYTRSVIRFKISLITEIMKITGDEQIFTKLLCYPGAYIPSNNNNYIRFDQMIKEICTFTNDMFKPQASVILRLIELLSELCSETLCSSPVNDNQNDVATILEHIRNNYSKKISLDDLSKKVGLSKYHMCRSFKKSTGMTISRYILCIRITEAKKLLLTTDKSITEIAFLSGFETYTYFSACFKKNECVSPREFRNNHIKRIGG